MKAIDRHTKVVRIVVFQDGYTMRALRLHEIVSQFHGGVKYLEGGLLLLLCLATRFGSFVGGRALSIPPSLGRFLGSPVMRL